MALISTTDLEAIKKDINDIVQDTSVNTLIKYRQFTGEGYYNPKYQEIPTMYTDWSGVSAIKGLVTRNEMETTSGIEIGDTKFVIMQSSVSNALSVGEDIVVESGVSYNVKKISLDSLGIAYQIFVEAA